MGAMASQITSVSIVYSPVCSGTDQRKHHWLRITGFCEGNSPGTGEFPAQKASNPENVSIWWRHRVIYHFMCRFGFQCSSWVERPSCPRSPVITCTDALMAMRQRSCRVNAVERIHNPVLSKAFFPPLRQEHWQRPRTGLGWRSGSAPPIVSQSPRTSQLW